MTTDMPTEEEIAALAEEADAASTEFRNLGLMQSPIDAKARAIARLRYEKARVRDERASKALYEAIRRAAEAH